MKKTVILLALVMAGLTSLSPFTRAQSTRGRNNTTTARPAATSSTARPAASSTTTRPTANASTTRPGASSTTTRPGGSTTTNRPGNTSPTQPSAPSASQRPGTPNQRPVSNPPSVPTTNPIKPPTRPVVPSRPNTPPNFNYYRPTPPPTWRPSASVPHFNSILGVALGTFLSNSINSFYTNGYNVTGYNSNQVFLSNVNIFNVIWPEATMFYTNGYLSGSLFSYASYTYDPSRYNYVYNKITSQYGLPVSTQNLSNGGMSCTWWGYNNYITLSFFPEYIPGYGQRYFTTLSMGN